MLILLATLVLLFLQHLSLLHAEGWHALVAAAATTGPTGPHRRATDRVRGLIVHGGSITASLLAHRGGGKAHDGPKA